jgi:hypothetical protein
MLEFSFDSHFFYLAVSFFSVITIIVLLSIYNSRAKVPLNEKSVVVITGACMGIGRETALILAKKYSCAIIVFDVADHLFPQLRKNNFLKFSPSLDKLFVMCFVIISIIY